MDELLSKPPLAREHPVWRPLLLSDGSVARHLQLLTTCAVTVDYLSIMPVSAALIRLPPAAELEHLQREVRRPDPAAT